jgi:N6-adenosine-specific RNA methylase IME4
VSTEPEDQIIAAIDAAEVVRDPLEGSAERAAVDPAAPFAVETVNSQTLTVIVPVSTITVPTDRMRRLRLGVVDELAESIAARGLIEPIIVQPTGSGYRLVVGGHRFAAVKQLGQAGIKAIIVDGLDADSVRLVEIDENLVRADLTPAERAIHFAERKRLYEKAHPETVSVRVRGGPGRGKKNESRNATRFASAFIDDTAKKLGKHRATVAREVARATKISSLADVPGTALDKADELDALAKLPTPVQRALISRAKSGEKVTAKHVAKKLQREARERDLASATETLGKNVYGVIYADPPWRFELWAESGRDRVADNHYPCMPQHEIGALPVPAADDCVLFLWATVPMLPAALYVLAAWSFTYKSAIFWNKDGSPGTGYWTRNEVEILLIGVRGDVPAPLPGEQPPQVIQAPRGAHSEKPTIFAEIIGKLYPNTPKLKMFARRARPGWDVWGNEARPPHIPDDLSIPDFLRRPTEAGE